MDTLNDMQGKVNTMQRRLWMMLMAKASVSTSVVTSMAASTLVSWSALTAAARTCSSCARTARTWTRLDHSVDHSGSMHGREIFMAQATIAICEAIEGSVLPTRCSVSNGGGRPVNRNGITFSIPRTCLCIGSSRAVDALPGCDWHDAPSQ